MANRLLRFAGAFSLIGIAVYLLLVGAGSISNLFEEYKDSTTLFYLINGSLHIIAGAVLTVAALRLIRHRP